jgi:hypothetical protein
MPTLISLLAILLSAATLAHGQSQTKRYLYMSMPDAAQKEGRSGTGILVFDIDNGHKFVRRIEVPSFEEGLRGFAGSKKNHSVYFSTTNRRVGAFDLESEKIVWDKTYDGGADRSSITMDGTKLYVPTGFWYSGEDSGLLVLNAKNGDFIKRIKVGPAAHNSIVSLDGRFLYLGTQTMLTIFDTKDERVIRQIPDVGERGIFPYTVDSRNRIAYVCLGNHVGFDVVDLEKGKALHRVYASFGGQGGQIQRLFRIAQIQQGDLEQQARVARQDAQALAQVQQLGQPDLDAPCADALAQSGEGLALGGGAGEDGRFGTAESCDHARTELVEEHRDELRLPALDRRQGLQDGRALAVGQGVEDGL